MNKEKRHSAAKLAFTTLIRILQPHMAAGDKIGDLTHLFDPEKPLFKPGTSRREYSRTELGGTVLIEHLNEGTSNEQITIQVNSFVGVNQRTNYVYSVWFSPEDKISKSYMEMALGNGRGADASNIRMVVFETTGKNGNGRIGYHSGLTVELIKRHYSFLAEMSMSGLLTQNEKQNYMVFAAANNAIAREKAVLPKLLD